MDCASLRELGNLKRKKQKKTQDDWCSMNDHNVTCLIRKESGLTDRMTCPHLGPESVLPGSGDDGSDPDSQGGRDRVHRFATSPSQQDVILLCKTKKRRKIGRVAVEVVSILGEKKSQVAYSPLAIFSLYTRKKVSAKVGETMVSNIQSRWIGD